MAFHSDRSLEILGIIKGELEKIPIRTLTMEDDRDPEEWNLIQIIKCVEDQGRQRMDVLDEYQKRKHQFNYHAEDAIRCLIQIEACIKTDKKKIETMRKALDYAAKTGKSSVAFKRALKENCHLGLESVNVADAAKKLKSQYCYSKETFQRELVKCFAKMISITRIKMAQKDFAAWVAAVLECAIGHTVETDTILEMIRRYKRLKSALDGSGSY